MSAYADGKHGRISLDSPPHALIHPVVKGNRVSLWNVNGVIQPFAALKETVMRKTTLSVIVAIAVLVGPVASSETQGIRRTA